MFRSISDRNDMTNSTNIESYRNQSNEKILCLQGYRAIAFIGIFLSHTGITLFNVLGPWGVSVFLILSGFLMTINYYKKDRVVSCSFTSNVLFAWNKIKKLYPLHILMLFVAIPVVGLKDFLSIKKFIIFIEDVILVQSWAPKSSVYFSFNAVSWYLSVCLFLYFCFPWIIKIIEKYKTKNTAYCILCLMFGIQLFLAFFSSKINNDFLGSDGFTKWFVYIFPMMRLIDFIVGCNVGYLYNIRSTSNTEKSTNVITLFLVIIMIAICVLFQCFFPKDEALSHQEIWYLYSCIFTLVNALMIYVIAINKGVLSSVLNNSLFVTIGNLSANAFLIHQLVLRYVGFAVKYLPIDNLLQIIIMIVLSFAVTIGLSWLWQRYYQVILDYVRRTK